MRLSPIDRLLKNLGGDIPPRMRREYMPPETAYKKLKEMTGEDFGMDVARWKIWVNEQKALGRQFRIRK
jgi:hypothetical protein